MVFQPCQSEVSWRQLATGGNRSAPVQFCVLGLRQAKFAAAQMLFGLLSAVMVGVKYKSDKRATYLHHGSWAIKLVLWLLFNLLPFFFPVGLIDAYCKSAAHAQV